jgi:hypothetical protein
VRRTEAKLIRFDRDELALVLARARQHGRRPACYIREAATGRLPRARSSAPTALIVRLGKAATRLQSLSRQGPTDGELNPWALEAIAAELLALVREFG